MKHSKGRKHRKKEQEIAFAMTRKGGDKSPFACGQGVGYTTKRQRKMMSLPRVGLTKAEARRKDQRDALLALIG